MITYRVRAGQSAARQAPVESASTSARPHAHASSSPDTTLAWIGLYTPFQKTQLLTFATAFSLEHICNVFFTATQSTQLSVN